MSSPPVSGDTPDRLDGDDWVELVAENLGIDEAASWVCRPHCGASVVFIGTVRDHAEGRSGVSELTYEAYSSVAVARMTDVAAAGRQRWPSLGRILIRHRTGRLAVTDVAVVVAVSAPHRGDAFEAAAWIIDTVKSAVPIWKLETWADGQDWGTAARSVADPSDLQRPAVGPPAVHGPSVDRS